jgi:hypothetical protein
MNASSEKKPGATNTRLSQTDYGATYQLLRSLQRPFFAVGWRIEQECARIEKEHELDKWNCGQ